MPAISGLHSGQTVYRKRRAGRLQIATASPITNVVVLVMENRTPDNLFAAYYGKPYGNTGLTWGVPPGPNVANPNGAPTLSQVGLGNVGDPDHSHENGFKLEFDSGNNDGWANELVHCPRKVPNCVPPTAFSYVPAFETTTYRTLAERFAIADNVFQANEGPSFVAHQYLISGQSGGTGSGSLTKPFAMAENTKRGANGLDDVIPSPWNGSVDPVFEAPNSVDYCAKGAPETVRTVDMTSNYKDQLAAEIAMNGNPQDQPCENYQTIFDASSPGKNALSWEYHWSPGGLALWAAPAAVKHLATSPNFMSDQGGLGFIQEAMQGNLPALTYVTPCLQDSDHPNNAFGTGVGGKTGPAWVATLLNAVGANPNLWTQTAVFVVWDDWGGWYDHVPTGHPAQNVYPNGGGGVPPNPSDPNEWGFRVPLLIVSPYAKSGYVSSTMRSYSSILKFIEWNYNLSPLGTDDTYVDNLTDAFNFKVQTLPMWKPLSVPNGYTPCSGT